MRSEAASFFSVARWDTWSLALAAVFEATAFTFAAVSRAVAVSLFFVSASAPGEPAALSERVMLPAVSDEDAKTLFPGGWKAPKPYLRVVKQPT